MKSNYSIIPKVFQKNPLLSLKVIKAFYSYLKAIFVDRVFGKGKTKELSFVYFMLTPICNLRCVMCGQRGIKGLLKGHFAAEKAKDIVPLETYKKLVDEIAPKKPIIYLWGGEPFLYPDLFPLIEYMMQKGLFVSVNTNGTFLEKYAEQIVKSKWHALFVSLDGFEGVNDKIRGKGSYKRVIDGFAAINREKKRQKAQLPYMGVVTTVNNMNYKHLFDLAQAAQDFKLAWHIFNLGTYTNKEIIDQQEIVLKEKFNTKVHCLEGYNTGFNEGIDGQELYGILTKIHEMKTDHPIITVPALQPDKINIYYSSLITPVRDNCTIPWSQANINYNGDVHFCADYPDYVIGNIKKEPFLKIFNNNRAVKFRNELKNSPGGIFPGCLRCYQNMLCGKKVKGF